MSKKTPIRTLWQSEKGIIQATCIEITIHQALRHLTNGKATVKVNGATVGQYLNDLVN